MREPGWPEFWVRLMPSKKRHPRMTEQRPQRVRALFEQAADLPRADQEALLDACCASDTDLRARVEYLLACDARLRDDAPPAWLDSPLVRAPLPPADSGKEPSTQEHGGLTEDRMTRTTGEPVVGALPGRLGRYELLEEI